MRKTLGVVLATIVAGAVGFGLPAAASASPTHPEHFQLAFTSPNGPGSILASGFFTAGGTDYQGNNVDVAVFHNGGFSIDHRGANVSFVVNQQTCAGKISGSNVPFSLYRGFGAFKGIAGAGTANVQGSFVTGRNPVTNKCNFRILSFIETIRATAQVSL
jgi:hypothetical protein